MSSTPFTEFCKKLHDDRKLSDDLFKRVLDVFKPYDLTQEQVQALLSGSKDRIYEEVCLEQKAAGYWYGGGGGPPPPPTHCNPMHTWGGREEGRGG